MSKQAARDETIKARVRPAEKELVRAASRVAGVTPSELVRTAAVAEAKRVLVGSGGR